MKYRKVVYSYSMDVLEVPINAVLQLSRLSFIISSQDGLELCKQAVALIVGDVRAEIHEAVGLLKLCRFNWDVAYGRAWGVDRCPMTGDGPLKKHVEFKPKGIIRGSNH